MLIAIAIAEVDLRNCVRYFKEVLYKETILRLFAIQRVSELHKKRLE